MTRALVLLVSLLGACAFEPEHMGERPVTGECLEGYVCDETIPSATFRGHVPVAVGGVVDFEAVADDPSQRRLTLASEDPAVIEAGHRQLIGIGPGTTRILAVSPTIDDPLRLVDWLTVESLPVASVGVRPVPPELVAIPAFDVFDASTAFFAGATTGLGVEVDLRAGDGRAVFDDAAVIVSQAPLPPSEPSHTLTVEAAGEVHDVAIPVVATVDHVDAVPLDAPSEPSGWLCIVPRTADGRPIVGAPISAQLVTRSGTIPIEFFDAFGPCLFVARVGRLDVVVDGIEVSFLVRQLGAHRVFHRIP